MEYLQGLSIPVLTTQEESELPNASGGFGDIHEASLVDGTTVAIKYCRLRVDDDRAIASFGKNFRREIKTWYPLNHPNLVALLGISANPSRRGGSSFPGMVTAWRQHGHAMKYLEDLGVQAVTQLRLRIVTDAAMGLQHLHGKGILHGDLKGNNVLINDNGTACLTDFGLSTVLIETSSKTFSSSDQAQGGNARWQDPVLVLGDGKHSYNTDVFAFGRLMLEILSGTIPFSNKRDVQVIAALIGNEQPKVSLPADLDNRVENVIFSCWDHGSRPSALDLARNLNEIRSERRWKPLSDITYELNLDFGRTYKGIWKEFEGNEIEVALSFQRWGDRRETQRFSKKTVTRLVAILMSLTHPHVLQVFGAYPIHRGDALVLPWIRGGILTSSAAYKTSSQEEKLTWVMQLASAINYMHRRSPALVHGRLYDEELFLGDRSELILRVTMAYYMPAGGTSASMQCSRDIDNSFRYVAPEALTGEYDTLSADIWGLGMTAYCVISGNQPFHDWRTQPRVLLAVMGGQLPKQLDIVPPIWQLLNRCWCKEPEERISATEFHDAIRKMLIP